ncbi:MAG TPA: FeoC-like transcriptional regulator [Anaerolineae bacterium]
MIEELLSRLKRGGVLTVAQMARELHTTPALVAQMIEHLERLGCVKSLSAECSVPCGGCPVAVQCRLSDRARVWVVNGLEADKRTEADTSDKCSR